MDVDSFIEELLGKFVDIAIYDLYWNNSLFVSPEFSKIVTDLAAKDKCLKVATEKKRLFRVIIRNMVYMAKCKTCSSSNFRIPYIFEMYFLYGLYVKNPMYFFNVLPDITFNQQEHQLTFLHKVVCNNNFPSKYDCHCELYDFAIECEHMSKFVAEKKATTGSVCSGTTTSSSTSSIDKIIETITKLIESETPNLSEEDQNILNEIDSEVNSMINP
jgi:hypothetical protein|tara:strand:- start:769 stop:1416 length:648 start_codon:yes stop_codon:yes gene_type:complete